MPTAPTKHALRSPSGSSRWLACHYSLRAPSTPPSAASSAGDRAHEWGARTLAGECELADVPDDLRAGLTMYVDHVRANGVDPIVEQCWESMEIEDYFGTIDCLLIRDSTAVIYDLKWGEIPVKAQNNTQLLSYASIIHEHFAVDTFHGVIIQPNAKGRPNISVAQYSESEVINHRERVRATVNSDMKQVGRQCLFCSLRYNKQCAEGVEFARQRKWKYKV